MKKEDSLLIREINDGNLSSFNILMQNYEKYVYKIAYGFGQSPDNAMDIVQNVFVKVFQKLSTFNQEGSFKSWLGRVSYNEGVNWVRANQNIRNYESFNEENQAIVFSKSNEDEYLAKENKSELIKCLFDLNTRYRLAVVLRYFEDMPIKDIALTLDCSEGVVKNMLFRSLKKLKNNLQKQRDLE